MTGLEVEDLTAATLIAAAGTEHFTGVIPSQEHQLVGFRNREGFTVALFHGNLKMSRQALGNGVSRIDHENPFSGIIVPGQVTGGTHQLPEDLGVMRGVQSHQAHTLHDMVIYPVNHLVRNPVVAHMTPPEQNVGVIQNLISQAAVGIIQGSGTNHEFRILPQGFRHGFMEAVGVIGTANLIGLFVQVFIPNSNTKHV